MEKKAREWEQRTLINELSQGMELAKQLGSHLHPSSSIETRESLVKKILSSYDKALKLLKRNDSADRTDCRPNSNGCLGLAESQPSLSGSSPRSDGSDRDLKDQYQKEVFKKRKMQPQWTEQVRICGGSGIEGPLQDGYSWRKYGQKEILGANFPRGYYRCSHRHVQGCLATKQVQRSDEEPAILEITYRGKHTCNQTPHLAAPLQVSARSRPERKVESRSSDQQPQEILLNFKLKKEDLETKDQIFPSFSFPEEDYVFPQPAAGNSMIGGCCFSAAFASPAASESDFVLVSAACRMDGQDLWSTELDAAAIISDPTSVSDSPIGGGLEFSLGAVELDPDFSFDALEFFP